MVRSEIQLQPQRNFEHAGRAALGSSGASVVLSATTWQQGSLHTVRSEIQLQPQRHFEHAGRTALSSSVASVVL